MRKKLNKQKEALAEVHRCEETGCDCYSQEEKELFYKEFLEDYNKHLKQECANVNKQKKSKIIV